MNFYTLDYDCNTPTTQQINVPTNTDYKVGVKVKKDGEVVNISPENVTVGEYELDAEKTNGYVTYTTATEDEASYTQLDVKVDKGYDGFGPSDASNFQTKLTSSLSKFNLTTTAETLAPCVGKTILSENVKMEYSLDGENWKDIDGVKMAGFLDFWVKVGDEYPFKYKLDERKWLDLRGASTLEEAKRLDALVFQDGYSIYHQQVTGNKFPPACPDFSGSLSTSNPLYIRALMLLGDGELHATFKLNVNTFKSQKGDINIVERASTVNFAGTDGQGKPFSYDIITK